MVLRAFVVALLLGLLAQSGGAAPQAQRAAPRVIEITAERFEFWPSEITIADGEEVELRIRSYDTMHGFRIVGAGTNVMVPKRGKGAAVARFTARAGRYTFECSRLCGAGHNFMRGVLIVRSSSPGSAQ
jgi:heme/copper-type cytochrome/quinol oxidase subunit 2